MATEQKHTPTPIGSVYKKNGRYEIYKNLPPRMDCEVVAVYEQKDIDALAAKVKELEAELVSRPVPVTSLMLQAQADSAIEMIKELEAQLSGFEEYLKEGETPFECLKRNRADADYLIGYSAEKMKLAEDVSAKLSRVEAQRDELLSALIRIRDINTADCEKYVRIADSIACVAIAKIESEKLAKG